MFCRECGKEFEGKFCPNCGEPAQEQHHENISTAPVKKPINKNLSTVLWLIFFFPVGLYFMWKSGWDKSIKAAISIFFGVVVITIALGGENWPFALSLIGFFGFIGSVVYLVVTIIKKQFPKTALVAMGLCFFAFMGGIVNSTSDSANPAITDTDVKVPATSSQQSNDKSSAEQSSSNGFADGFKEGFNGSSSNVESEAITLDEKIGEPSNSSESSTESDSKHIYLKDGEVGDYGKSVTLDGETSVWYYIPQGTYSVQWSSESMAKLGRVFVESDVIKKNSEGYVELDIMDETEFMDDNSEKQETIEIKENEHVFITLNSIFIFTRIE